MAADQPRGRGAAEHDAVSTAELARLASAQVSRLVRDECRLAREEMAVKARLAGVGAGLFGGAGVVALYAMAVLLATLMLVLALVMPAWTAALVVAVLVFAGSVVMALIGRRQLRQMGSVIPEQTINSVKADVRAVSRAAKERRSR
jgi:uncharacterized membrane protein